MYKAVPVAAAVALFAASATALPALERNIAYRSPSTSVGGSGLAHDIGAIGRQIVQRQELKKRNNDGKGGTQADFLVAEYDATYGPDGKMAYTGGMTFPFGVASGDPYSDSAILWTHPQPIQNSSDPICLHYETAKDSSFKSIVDSSYAWTTSDVDYAWKVETTGLEALTQYYYRMYACHNKSLVTNVGTFKTMPEVDDDSVNKLKIAVFSCSNLPWGYFNAFRQAAEMDDVDLAVHVGDYIYENRGDGGLGSYGDGRALNRVPEPNKEIVTLSDYRLRYASYRRDPDLQALHQKKAWLLVWDDHEVADNTWKGGSALSNNTEAGTIDGVNFTDRKRNAVKAYFEWTPIRQVDTTDGLRIWRKFQYGKLADIFMLDTRQYDRDITDVYYNTDEIALLANDTNRSLMGGKQEKWFYENLIQAQKRESIWKIVGQQVIINHLSYGLPSFPINYDQWDGYQANRRRMFKTIKDNNIDNLVFLAGDSHAAWTYDAVSDEGEASYDPATGDGALGVEFAGTAVSSPSSYGRTLTPAQYVAAAQRLVKINKNLQYAEGRARGFFSVSFTKTQAKAEYWGIVNNTQPNSDQELLATFLVEEGANKLTRPINGGNNSTNGGALQSQEVDYSKQKWNGTAFV